MRITVSTCVNLKNWGKQTSVGFHLMIYFWEIGSLIGNNILGNDKSRVQILTKQNVCKSEI